jgi:Carbohydrate binding
MVHRSRSIHSPWLISVMFFHNSVLQVLFSLSSLSGIAASAALQACADAFYPASNYTCYDGDFLCPVIDGVKTLRCGADCYLPSMYSCVLQRESTLCMVLIIYRCSGSRLSQVSAYSATGSSICVESANQFHLSDPPYENYFYSDCHSSSQVVVTSPIDTSNLTIIGPRLLVSVVFS